MCTLRLHFMKNYSLHLNQYYYDLFYKQYNQFISVTISNE